jgi:hypothetical protein
MLARLPTALPARPALAARPAPRAARVVTKAAPREQV